MKLIAKIICVTALTMPLLANAAAITAINNTGEFITLCLGSVNACPKVYPHQAFVIPESYFNNACAATKTCKLIANEYDLLPSPTQTQIAILTFNAHDGVISADKNSESKIDVTPNRFDITFTSKVS